MDQLQTRLDAVEQQVRTVYCRLPWWRSGHRRRAPMTRRPHGGARLWTIGLVLGWMTAAAGQTIQCGDILGPGGVFQLQADVLCGEDDPPIALTVRDGAHLDLGGHTVTALGTAVRLEGRGAVLQNGKAGSGLAAIAVAGGGGHTVRGIVATLGSHDDGILVVSDHNRVVSNIGSGNNSGLRIEGGHNLVAHNTGLGQDAIRVTGDHNLLLNNHSGEDQHLGFTIEGDNNVLVGNQVRGVGEGVAVRGDSNTVVRNLITRSETGIFVPGEDNRLIHNTALDNGIDLVDTHEDCDGNVWQGNVFQTSRAGAIANPACIQ
jgi:Periplasmic copper-binding protein (NosD)